MRFHVVISGLAVVATAASGAVDHPEERHNGIKARTLEEAVQICDPSTQGQFFHEMTPCGKAKVIEETICQPLSVGHIALKDHAQCMCNGDFFSLKKACEHCIQDHAGMSELEFGFYDGILAKAHHDLCDVAVPAAPFASIWSVYRDTATMPTDGATALVNAVGTATAEPLYPSPSASSSKKPAPVAQPTADVPAATSTKKTPKPKTTPTKTALVTLTPVPLNGSTPINATGKVFLMHGTVTAGPFTRMNTSGSSVDNHETDLGEKAAGMRYQVGVAMLVGLVGIMIVAVQ